VNVTTNRIYPDGSMIGQDDILFSRDRLHTFRAGSELYTLRLERDVFEKMMKEFPDMKEEILNEANLRSKYQRQLDIARNAIVNKE
jgi:CRP-like cAMP-binding protein